MHDDVHSVFTQRQHIEWVKMLNFEDLAEKPPEAAKIHPNGRLTEKTKRDIVLYCVSMDEIQLSAGQG